MKDPEEIIARNAKLLQENKDLKTQLRDLQKELGKLKITTEQIEKENEALRNDRDELKSVIRQYSFAANGKESSSRPEQLLKEVISLVQEKERLKESLKSKEAELTTLRQDNGELGDELLILQANHLISTRDKSLADELDEGFQISSVEPAFAHQQELG